ncbi:MAG: indole-3-glycerol phosphate synthase TrpC [Oscillospiraceae bacterium]
MFLDEIIAKKAEKLLKEKKEISSEEMRFLAENLQRKSIDFKAAITFGKPSIIAEIKRASPSKGGICKEFNPIKIAENYEKNGANALSILTEEDYFLGSSEVLKKVRKISALPILRKDFIIDSYQIFQSKIIGADAILLIAAALKKETLSEFLMLAKTLGLAALVEVHNEIELETAVDLGAEIIGINNRNLKTFEVDLAVTKCLAKLVPDGKIVVSESGMGSFDDVKFATENGADAVLIGEAFMRSENLSETFKFLRGKTDEN